MKTRLLSLGLACFAGLFVQTLPAQDKRIPNPQIDYRLFLQEAARLEPLRESHRVTEADFQRMAAAPGTIVLDARSAANFRRLHLRGAINLSLPDFTAVDLARVIPDKRTRILIYCNNNFSGAPDALMAKTVSASLNIYTFNALHSYGYTNVYELGPVLPFGRSRVEFEGDSVRRTR